MYVCMHDGRLYVCHSMMRKPMLHWTINKTYAYLSWLAIGSETARKYIHTHMHRHIHTYIHTYIAYNEEGEQRRRLNFSKVICDCHLELSIEGRAAALPTEENQMEKKSGRHSHLGKMLMTEWVCLRWRSVTGMKRMKDRNGKNE
jgi:hypothetical protein